MKAGPSWAREVPQRSHAVRISTLIFAPFSTPGYREVGRLRPHAFDPGSHGGETVEGEAPLVRDVGVGVEGDVGDGVAARDEEAVVLEVALHHSQGRVAALALGLERGP